jgi:hypothetical protein
MIRSLLGRNSFGWILFAALATGAIVMGGWDMPLAWDDGLQANYGRFALDFFLSGGVDRGYENLSNLKYYGATFELFSAAMHRALGAELYAYRSFLIGAVAMLGVAWTILLGRRLGLGRWSWLAGLLLALHPQFWGQAFVNSKDIPMLTATVGWWLAYLRWADSGFRWNAKWVVASLALGVLLSIRVMALVVVPGPLLLGLYLWWQKRSPEDRRVSLDLVRAFPWLPHLLIVPIMWIVMIAFWPFALRQPITGPFIAIHHFLTFPFTLLVEIAGEVYPSHELPRYAVLLEHFLAQPLIWLLLLTMGGWSLGRAVCREVATADRMLVALVLWLLPLQLLFLIHPGVTYHGVRHTLFYWPAYALLAAVGLRAGIGWVTAHAPSSRRWVPAFLLAFLVAQFLQVYAWHPYAYVFRNSLTRLLPGSYTGFSGDYHGLSVKEGLREVSLDSYPWSARALVIADPWAATLFDSYTGERIEMVSYPTEFFDRGEPPSNYQYFVLLEWFRDGRISPWLSEDLFKLFPLDEPFATISVEGIPLAYVYRLFDDEETGIAEADGSGESP